MSKFSEVPGQERVGQEKERVSPKEKLLTITNLLNANRGLTRPQRPLTSYVIVSKGTSWNC